MKRNHERASNRDAVSVDVTETPDAFHVSMRLPGVTGDDLTLNVVGNLFTVTGDLRDERELAGDNPKWKMQIQRFGAFEHRLTLPVAVEPNDSFEFEGGVLRLHLPKASGFVKSGAAEAARAESEY
jgi:HSP20 family protein